MVRHPNTIIIAFFYDFSSFCANSCGVSFLCEKSFQGGIIFAMNIKHFLLKAIPYVMSIAGGIIVFDVSQKYMHSLGWIDLMDNIAASLLAIPLVFLFYDYSNFLVTRRMNRNLRKHVINTVDDFLFKILGQIKRIINVKQITVPMQELNLNYKNLNFDARYMKTISKYLRQMEELLYKSDKIQILEPQHTQILSFIAQEINQILNECKYHNSPREIARYLETTLSMIDDWFAATGYATRKETRDGKI